MGKRGKRGLSGVIATLIIIVISLAAVVIVWAVIKNIVDSGSEEVQLGKFTLNLEIEKVAIKESTIEVTVKRNPGKGDMKELSFVVSDGTNSQTFKQAADIEELGQQTFSINYIGPIKTITISPSIESGAQANTIDTLEYTDYETAKNMQGLVSWWRMEGNPNDEMGINNGILSEADLPILVNGKFGKAYRFTNPYQNVWVNDSPSLRLENSNMTIVAWVNKTTSSNTAPYGMVVTKGDFYYGAESGYYFGNVYVDSTTSKNVFGTNNFAETDGGNIKIKRFSQIAATQEVNGMARTIKSYINGSLMTEKSNPSVNPISSLGYNLTIGANNGDYNLGYESFNGMIDEVMIFNRTLTESEMQILYNLDLSN